MKYICDNTLPYMLWPIIFSLLSHDFTVFKDHFVFYVLVMIDIMNIQLNF